MDDLGAGGDSFTPDLGYWIEYLAFSNKDDKLE